MPLENRGVSKEDADLAVAAKKVAGGPAALAAIFGVTAPAASEWGRTRPIPRHLKPRLRDYVQSSRSPSSEEPAAELNRPSSALIRDLVRFLEGSVTDSVAHLPRRYQKRYEERLLEVITRIKRDLEEYRAVLEAENRARPSRRTRSTKPR
jgi:hypothetical protein